MFYQGDVMIKNNNKEKELNYLKLAMNEIGAYVFIKNTKGIYTYVNNLVLDLFHISKEEIIGYDDTKFFDLKTSNQLLINDKKVINEGKFIECEETNIIKETGEMKIHWTVKKPIRDKNNQIIGLVGISTDITQRKIMENKLQKKNHFLSAIFNNIDAYIYVKDNNRTYKFVNKKVSELFKLPLEKIIGKKEDEILSKEISDDLWKMDKKVFDTGSKISGHESFVDKNGVKRYFWSIKVPLKQKENQPILIGVSSDITKLHQLKKKLEYQAKTDFLTGFYNRRSFIDVANKEFDRSIQSNNPLSLVVFDVDHFKSINDRFGHPAGDSVLACLGQIGKKFIHHDHTIARVGGEEFAVLLTNNNLNDAKIFAEKLRLIISKEPFKEYVNEEISITVSLGVTSVRNSDDNFEDLYKRADQLLYDAKKKGRNQVCTS